VRRILLLGVDGLLGSTVHVQLSGHKDLELVTTARKIPADFQFTYSPRALRILVHQTQPDVVINCIASTSNNASFWKSFVVNSLLPIQLAQLSQKHRFSTVHFSTNAVFSGRNQRNSERTFPIPRTRYGITKLIGDLSFYRNLVVRTSFIGVSPNPEVKSGLVEKLRNTPINGHISIQDNSSWNGITSFALSEVTCAVIRENYLTPGIFHIGSSSLITRHELIKAILTLLGRDDVTISVTNQNPRSNLALETNKVGEISEWWSRTRYVNTPDSMTLVREAI
jgi:dTDP-4-dehydrorhamnose reductase